MRICVCVRRRRLPCPKTRRVSRRKMPSPLNSNRPVDVSFEEEKRLLALFDLCLQAIREEKDSDNLTVEFKFELEKSQLDEESRVLLSNLFDRAVASELSEYDYVDFITILQKNSPKELNDDERDSLRRLEFLLALAVEKTRIKVYASIGGRRECVCGKSIWRNKSDSIKQKRLPKKQIILFKKGTSLSESSIGLSASMVKWKGLWASCAPTCLWFRAMRADCVNCSVKADVVRIQTIPQVLRLPAREQELGISVSRQRFYGISLATRDREPSKSLCAFFATRESSRAFPLDVRISTDVNKRARGESPRALLLFYDSI